MHRIIPFFKLIRWPNLVMTCIGILSSWYFLIYSTNQQTVLQVDFVGIILLATAFSLIMGAGYIINDIFDKEIDAINKPEQLIIGKYFSIPDGWIWYFIFNFCGLVISIYAAARYDKGVLLFFLPVGIISLYFYSKWLKKRAPWGNLLISALCALALWMPAFGEWQMVIASKMLFNKFLACGIIAGICMFMREVIKSQEDIKGDQSNNAMTLPIIWGMKKVTKLNTILNLVACISIAYIIYFFNIELIPTTVVVFTMILPLIVLEVLFVRKSTSGQYRLHSYIIKIIMAAGMIVLPWALSNFRS